MDRNICLVEGGVSPKMVWMKYWFKISIFELATKMHEGFPDILGAARRKNFFFQSTPKISQLSRTAAIPGDFFFFYFVIYAVSFTIRKKINFRVIVRIFLLAWQEENGTWGICFFRLCHVQFQKKKKKTTHKPWHLHGEINKCADPLFQKIGMQSRRHEHE